jgi:hypothetical protein
MTPDILGQSFPLYPLCDAVGGMAYAAPVVPAETHLIQLDDQLTFKLPDVAEHVDEVLAGESHGQLASAAIVARICGEHGSRNRWEHIGNYVVGDADQPFELQWNEFGLPFVVANGIRLRRRAAVMPRQIGEKIVRNPYLRTLQTEPVALPSPAFTAVYAARAQARQPAYYVNDGAFEIVSR